MKIFAFPAHDVSLQGVRFQQAQAFGAALQVLAEHTTTAELSAMLQNCTGEFAVVVDQYTEVDGAWPACVVDADVAIVGAPMRTGLGDRLGYAFVSSTLESEQHRRSPIAVPTDNRAAGAQTVDLPNEGAFAVRLSTFRELGGLKTELEPMLALMEYAVRAREHGLKCVSDTRVVLMRVPGFAEPTIADETAFRRLRSDASWHAFMRGFGRHMPHLVVHLVCVGGGKNAAALIERAGYPIERILWAGRGTPPAQIRAREIAVDPVAAVRDQLLNQRSRCCVILDTDLTEIPADWCVGLLEELDERDDVAIATLGSEGQARVVGAVDTAATVIYASRIPVHRIPPPAADLPTFLRELTGNFTGLGIGMRQTADTIHRAQALPERAPVVLKKIVSPEPVAVSIIIQSRGVADVNDLSMSRLRANTRDPYDITVVARRSAHDIISRLRADSSLRVLVEGGQNAGSEYLSYALSSVGGDYIAVLRDDFIVPEGWLTTLEAAMGRIPNAGVVAPRVSNGTGSQAAETERFGNTGEFHLAAARRRKEFARAGTVVQSLTEPAFLIRREVLERVGGFDPSLGLSEYAVLDFCIRVQAAGYTVVLAEDALLHKIDSELLPKETQNSAFELQFARAFVKKWQLGREGVMRLNISALLGTELAAAHRYCPFAVPPPAKEEDESSELSERAVFLLPVENNAAWAKAARLIKKYQKTFTADDVIVLSIGCMGDLDLETAGKRVERIIRDLNIDLERSADVLIADGNDRNAWLNQLPDGPRLLLLPDEELARFPQVKDLSPSGLRQSLQVASQGVA